MDGANLFQSGEFTLRSGKVARWKLECDALTPADWETLALMASEVLPPFGSVEGVPRGGIPFALALGKYVTEVPLLIAEDVCTTGGSMERHRNGRDAIGVAVFARELHWPSWVCPLFMVNLHPMLTKVRSSGVGA